MPTPPSTDDWTCPAVTTMTFFFRLVFLEEMAETAEETANPEEVAVMYGGEHPNCLRSMISAFSSF
nr:hypothetical protein Iba_chr04aCG20950 [Ipomoea batatas]